MSASGSFENVYSKLPHRLDRCAANLNLLIICKLLAISCFRCYFRLAGLSKCVLLMCSSIMTYIVVLLLNLKSMKLSFSNCKYTLITITNWNNSSKINLSNNCKLVSVLICKWFVCVWWLMMTQSCHQPCVQRIERDTLSMDLSYLEAWRVAMQLCRNTKNSCLFNIKSDYKTMYNLHLDFK